MLSVTFTAPLSAFAPSPLAAATQRAGSRPAVSMVESTKTNKEYTLGILGDARKCTLLELLENALFCVQRLARR